MLVLTRKLNEKVIINGNIVVTIVKLGKDNVRIGIDAPEDVKIFREEICPEELNVPKQSRRKPNNPQTDN